MMPGVTNFPVPSTISAPGGAASSPSDTATILPFCSRILPFFSVFPVASSSVALRTSTGVTPTTSRS
jgi:hypothetical protein